MTVLQGPLADRDAWSAIGKCPIEKTMGLVGTKSAMLILREAYYGTTRFDDFCTRVGVTKAAASARLNELVDAGLMTKRPYREPGQRAREEYVLTPSGVDFMPVVWAMFEWGRKHLPNLVSIASPEWRAWLKRGPSAHRPIGSKPVNLGSTTKNRDIQKNGFAGAEPPERAWQGVDRGGRSARDRAGERR